MERLYIIAYAFCLVTASYRQKARFQWGERRRKGVGQKVFGSEKIWKLLTHKLNSPFLGPAFKGLCRSKASPLPVSTYTQGFSHLSSLPTHFHPCLPSFFCLPLAKSSVHPERPCSEVLSPENQCPLSGTPVLWPASDQTSILFVILSFLLTT